MLSRLAAFITATTLAAAVAADFPAPPSLPTADALGPGLHRVRTLLSTSTAEKPQEVRVLFYGQSITEQAWWKQVADFLRTTYPHARLTIENRAIGGHSSQILYKTAEADLYRFQPDLVIFHVYGAHQHYETIIRRLRERTIADVLIQTDHFSKNDPLDEPTDPSQLTPAKWNPWMNHAFLPDLARKYGAALCPVREHWKNYLQRHALEPAALLKDAVHLNAHGEFLMAKIVQACLTPLSKPVVNPHPERLTLKPIGAAAKSLTVPFNGNRIDLQLTAPLSAEVKVTLNGQPVSAVREAWAFTKTSGYRGTNWPCLLRVQRGPAALLEEEWSVTLQEAADDYASFKFTVTGSKTGADGTGSGTERFVSKSGRLVIDPADWNLAYGRKVFGQKLAEDFVIRWQAEPLGRDQLPAGPAAGWITLAQNLPNTAHTVTLTSAQPIPAAAWRLYQPPFPATEPLVPDAQTLPVERKN
jgi:hypothetical protein